MIILLLAAQPASADEIYGLSWGLICKLPEAQDVDKKSLSDPVCAFDPTKVRDSQLLELGVSQETIDELDEIKKYLLYAKCLDQTKRVDMVAAFTFNAFKSERVGKAAKLTVLLERVNLKTDKRKKVAKAKARFEEFQTGRDTVLQAIVSKEFKWTKLKDEEINVLTWQTKGIGEVPAGTKITRFYDLGPAE